MSNMWKKYAFSQLLVNLSINFFQNMAKEYLTD